MTYLPRGVEPLFHRLLDATKVVTLEGGRGVGKSTLCQKIAEERDFQTYFDLSNPADRDLLANEPHRTLLAVPTPVLIDEAQFEPEVTVAVKRLVDRSPENGQVILTGSSRIGRGAMGGSDPLAGRTLRLSLAPMTQGELKGLPSSTVAQWWRADPLDIEVHPELALRDLYRRFVVGGLPQIALDLADTGDDSDLPERQLSAYVDAVITVALTDSRVERTAIHKTLRYLMANPGQILNISRAASELGISADTVRRHLSLAESAFLMSTVPALRPTEHKVVVSHPRLFAADTALAAWAANTSVDRLIRNPALAGALLENFIYNEVSTQASWSIQTVRCFHWRDSRGRREVDLVLRRSDNAMIAIEVKSAGRVNEADAAGIKAFARDAGDDLIKGIVMYTGRATRQLDDKIWAVPVSSLL